MAARAGMVNLILQLRELTFADVAQYTVGSVPYFTDDQLQAELDARASYFRDEWLDALPQYINGLYVYKEFTIPTYIPLWLEEEGGGTGGWAVKTSAGVFKTIAADYTVNYRSGVITFLLDQIASPTFRLDCRSYDMYRAAAAVWRQKAALEYRSVDWSNANTSFRASQRRDHCLAMAAQMESRAGIKMSRVWRTDELC